MVQEIIPPVTFHDPEPGGISSDNEGLLPPVNSSHDVVKPPVSTPVMVCRSPVGNTPPPVSVMTPESMTDHDHSNWAIEDETSNTLLAAKSKISHLYITYVYE